MTAISTETKRGPKRGEPEFLVCYHVPANTGYAIEPLEIIFYDVISNLTGSSELVHLGYKNYDHGRPRWAKGKTNNFVVLDYSDTSKDSIKTIAAYIRKNNIKTVLAIDLGVGSGIIKAFRDGGVRHILSYYGAPMSSLNHGIKLLLKRIEVFLTKYKPDHFIFESYGMQKTATHGRGIKSVNTSVVHLGIDVDRYSCRADKTYVYRTIG
ncbi:MAG: hypothetical protein ACWGOW_04120, partial [Gammaproteobacteria bacterium]